MWNDGQKSKGMGFRLGDYESDCLTNLRFASSKKMMCDFKQSTGSVEIENPPGQDENLRNQGTNKRNEVEINNIKVEI